MEKQKQKIRTLNTLHHAKKNSLYRIREKLSILQVRQQKAIGEIEELRQEIIREKNLIEKNPSALELQANWKNYQKRIEDQMIKKQQICAELEIHINKVHKELMDEYQQAKIYEKNLEEKKDFLNQMLEKKEEEAIHELITTKYIRSSQSR